ncbi:tetratricopeptide (TPR) repeat protein [Oxalobacteraceae bacterium GrIS 2.11]
MFKSMILVTVLLCLLTGCATPGSAPEMAMIPWQDQAFHYDASSITIGKDELFKLDPALQATIQRARPRLVTPDEKLSYLTNLLFGPDGHSFPYALNHSTTAAETWQKRRGDCLSLTVLAYSIAKTLGLAATMQQVQIPSVYSRNGRIDFVTGHVNLRTDVRTQVDSAFARSGSILIDFEAQVGSWERGQDLTEEGILARYDNNIGAEYLARGDLNMAYVYFKSALLTDPGYAPSYSNLAQLYLNARFDQDAEKLLRHAVTLDQDNYQSLNALSHLLQDQGRTEEASQLIARLKEKQNQDPYYWLGLGVAYLKDGHPQQSIAVLERAQNLSVGFLEIHHYLALAYWRAGKQNAAENQLSILASMGQDSAVLDLLHKKISLPIDTVLPNTN